VSDRYGQDAVERTIVEYIPAPPETVRNHYVDLDRIVEVHPLVVSVQTVSRRITEDGYEQTYRVKDRVPLGVLTLPITYTAVLRVPVSGPITAHARQFPGVRLDSVVSFDVDPVGTRLTERIRISAPRPLVAVTVRQAVAAHIATLAGMRRHFEAIGDDSGGG
jgi:hypothetical protein